MGLIKSGAEEGETVMKTGNEGGGKGWEECTELTGKGNQLEIQAAL